MSKIHYIKFMVKRNGNEIFCRKAQKKTGKRVRLI